jgi:uncharacterized protein YdiU (UPF0061 family)
VLREYLVSEAMAALGVPTDASAGGDHDRRAGRARDDAAGRARRAGGLQPCPRRHLSSTFAVRDDIEALQLLADHVIARHYPAAAQAKRPYRALLDAVIVAQAELVARWLLLGFIHGVMNTDNMSIAGETIDYGPCAFMDTYDPATVFSSIDRSAVMPTVISRGWRTGT